MKSIEYGVKRAYNEVIEGFVLSAIINSLEAVPIAELYDYLAQIRFLSFLGTLFLIVSTTGWTTGYFFGWCIGICILSYAGLVDIWDFILYLILPIGLRIVISYYKERV